MPVIGKAVLTTEGDVADDGDPAHTKASIPNPTPVVMKLHPVKGTLASQGEFAEFETSAEEVPPGGGEVVFESESRITNQVLGAEVAKRVTGGAGGPATIKAELRATLFWVWDFYVDVAKILNCRATPLHGAALAQRASLLRRGAAVTQPSLNRDGVTGGAVDGAHQLHHDVEIECSYVGNAN